MMLPGANPFATRFVRPGSLAFLFPPGLDAERLVERLRGTRWWGQIIGVHGAGKSTLLHTLVPRLQQADRRIVWFTLSAGQRRLPVDLVAQWNSWDSRSQMIVDGYEQLGRWARWRLRRQCRRRGCGLLVTSHRGVGFPTLLEVHSSLHVVQQLVEQLARTSPTDDDLVTLSNEDVARQYAVWGENVRELLFGLYDLYESRRHSLDLTCSDAADAPCVSETNRRPPSHERKSL
jgi:hypothetical protein